MKQKIKEAFSLHQDTADYNEIKERIISGGQVTGTNLCILMMAILIASIGLNMNSTAVIIGAMLISPIMGSIQAISYGVAIATALMPPLCTCGYGIVHGKELIRETSILIYLQDDMEKTETRRLEQWLEKTYFENCRIIYIEDSTMPE